MPEPETTNPTHRQTEYEEKIVAETMREFSQMQSLKATTAMHCEEIARLIDPNSRNTFMFGSFNWPGQKKTQEQIDASGAVALDRFESICDSLLTPQNQMWHSLEANDPYVMKDRATRLWFENATRRIFRLRYAPLANFAGQQQNNWRTLGAYGMPAMFIDALDGSNYSNQRGMRYRSCHFGEMFVAENHQGIVDHAIRWYRMTARQAHQKWGDKLPESLKAALAQNSNQIFEFLHRVCPRADYDPDATLTPKGKPFASYYVSLTGRMLMEEGGYRSFPFAISRFRQAPGEVYGRSPAMMILPALKTLNAEKRTFLKQGHRAADPVLLTTDDGMVDFSMRPGALNKGGWSSDGRPLVGTIPTGSIQISKEMMDEEKALIEDAFFTSLFKLILDENIATATQVMEIINQKGILIAPTMGRQQSELLGPMIDRELDIAAAEGLLDPMPPRLAEARGSYQVRYTGPLSKVQRTSKVLGFTRTVEFATQIANLTGDPSVLDPFDFPTAIPEIADIQDVPESWMASPEKMAAKAQARAQAQQADQEMKALPNIAAMKKAEAAQVKAGMKPAPEA